ncbi:hypothetical protein ACFLZP_00270 [Patescibacteria group bacterium]
MGVPQWWRLQNQYYQLVGEECRRPGCGAKIFPRRDVCPKCRNHGPVKVYELERDKATPIEPRIVKMLVGPRKERGF